MQIDGSVDESLGGYFALPISKPQHTDYRNALLLNNARNALLLLITARQPQHIWIPSYTCAVVEQIVQRSKVSYTKYHVDHDFLPVEEFCLGSDDILLYTNYFGVCDRNIQTVIHRYGGARVILDLAQSYYFKAEGHLGSIYSPRKFFPISDGGILEASTPVAEPFEIDKDSPSKMLSLLLRADHQREEGYRHFQEYEAAMAGSAPKRMSRLTESLWRSQSSDEFRERRVNNFAYLSERLGKYNQLDLNHSCQGPQCYPFLPTKHIDRSELHSHSIFVPCYWPYSDSNKAEWVSESMFERELRSSLLPLPCDQRYTVLQLARMADMIENILTQSSI